MLMLVILMLILMLLNLNARYADTDTDLCINFISLFCSNYNDVKKFKKTLIIQRISLSTDCAR